jgi:hypothetical protein
VFGRNESPSFSGPKSKPSKKLAEAGGKFSFEPEDGSDTFLRNVGLSPNYTTLQPRKL